MHVSRQPNTERWVQSNSPFSLVLRDRVDSKLAVAWSKLLAKAMPVKSWRLRVRLTERTGRWRSRWVRAWVERVSDLDQCVRLRRWVRAWKCAYALCEREGKGEWEWRVICVRRYFWKYPIWNRVSETRFPCLSCGTLKTTTETKFLRLGFTLSKSSLWDSRSMWANFTWRVHVELEF